MLEKADPYTTGRPRQVDLREGVNAIFYLNKTGCQWRYLPKDFPSSTRVSYSYHQGVDNTTGEPLTPARRQPRRKESGRQENPRAGISASQTVPGTPASAPASGFEGGQLSPGRQRPIGVDTRGGLRIVRVPAATLDAGRAARQVRSAGCARGETGKKVGAEGAEQGEEFIQGVKKQFDCVFEVVEKKKTGKGFQVLSPRWLVERTLAWLGRSRRLSQDDERKPTSRARQV